MFSNIIYTVNIGFILFIKYAIISSNYMMVVIKVLKLDLEKITKHSTDSKTLLSVSIIMLSKDCSGNFLYITDDDNCITLMPIQGQANSHTNFINASYIDVSRNETDMIMFIYYIYVLFVNIGIQHAKEVHSNSRCVMLTHKHIIRSHYPHRPY